MSGQNNITTLSHCPGQMKLQYCGSPVAIRLGATPCSKQMEREGERERDREGNHDRCTIPVEKYKVRNPALVPLFVLTAKQKLKWSHLIHSEKWYRLYGQAPYAPAYQTSHPFFCFASHNQKRLKQAEVMENRERTKQHHNFVTLPRANETGLRKAVPRRRGSCRTTILCSAQRTGALHIHAQACVLTLGHCIRWRVVMRRSIRRRRCHRTRSPQQCKPQVRRCIFGEDADTAERKKK